MGMTVLSNVKRFFTCYIRVFRIHATCIGNTWLMAPNYSVDSFVLLLFVINKYVKTY